MQSFLLSLLALPFFFFLQEYSQKFSERQTEKVAGTPIACQGPQWPGAISVFPE